MGGHITDIAPMATPPPIYPELPSAPPPEPLQFRLCKIEGVQKWLDDEREHHGHLYKKHKLAMNILDGIDTTLLTLTMGLGAAEVGLLSTIIAAPIAIGLEAGAISCGLTSAACKFTGHRLCTKAKKHDEIWVLAESKLDTISDHISHALKDGSIGNDEFSMILDEVAKYRMLKDQIRARAAHVIVEHRKMDQAERTSSSGGVMKPGPSL